MPSQDRDYSQIEAIQIDKKNQYSLDEEMTYKSALGHKGVFDSMDKYSGSKSLFGFIAVLAVVGASIGLGWGLTNVQDKSEDISVSSEECGDYQVKIYSADGFTCQDCKYNEYGKLDLCERESESGVCEVREDGCFAPKL